MKQKPNLDNLGLGDLVQEMHRIFAEDTNVVKPENLIPEESIDNYQTYMTIINEINRRYRWIKSIGSYSDKELKQLKFLNIKDFNSAIELCWGDPDLEGMPWNSEGTILHVPEGGIKYLKNKGLKFKVIEFHYG